MGSYRSTLSDSRKIQEIDNNSNWQSHLEETSLRKEVAPGI